MNCIVNNDVHAGTCVSDRGKQLKRRSVFVCARVCACVCVCVWEREREREGCGDKYIRRGWRRRLIISLPLNCTKHRQSNSPIALTKTVGTGEIPWTAPCMAVIAGRSTIGWGRKITEVCAWGTGPDVWVFLDLRSPLGDLERWRIISSMTALRSVNSCRNDKNIPKRRCGGDKEREKLKAGVDWSHFFLQRSLFFDLSILSRCDLA